MSEVYKRTSIMGVLNLTPDSFYDGVKNCSSEVFLKKYNKIKNADIVDVGAESSRPGSVKISVKEELKRLSLFKHIDFKNKIFSIDSYKPEIIEFCLNNGFKIINDISGGGKNFINIDLAAKYSSKIIIMHMKGTPQNMQVNPTYNNLIDDINTFFNERIEYAKSIGFNKKDIIIDPGIGFGKTMTHNYEILLNLKEFKHFNCKILIGASRKSFLKLNNDAPSERLVQSISISTYCILNNVDILRVHDVEEHLKVINIMSKLYNGNSRISR